MTTQSNEEKYSAKKDNELNNKLYALICPILNKHESRGFNSHARTQAIMEMVCKEMDEWISIQN